MTNWQWQFQEAAQRWGWLLLLALAPFFLFTGPATSPMLLVVPALLAVLWLRRPPSESRTPLDWALLLLAAMVLVSLWATYSLSVSLSKIAGLVFGLGLFYAAVAAGRGRPAGPAVPGGWAVITAVYLGLGAAVAAVGLVGTRWTAKIPALTAIAARLPAEFVTLPGIEQNGLQPNEVAGVLLWVVPVAVAVTAVLWLHFDALVAAHGGPTTTAVVVSASLAALATTAVLVLTQSRSALFGLTLAALAMGLLAGPRARWVTLALVAAGLVAASALYGPRLKAIYDYALTGATASDEPVLLLRGLSQRVEIWSAGVHGIEDFALTGMGLNTFRTLMFQRYALPLVSPDPEHIGHAHNTWLQVALDLGLPGLVAYLGVWIVAVHMMLQVILGKKDEGRTLRVKDGPRVAVRSSSFILHPAQRSFILRPLALGILGAFAGSFGYGLTDTVALGARPGLLWWLLLALAVLVWRQAQPEGVYSMDQSVLQSNSTVEKAETVGTQTIF